eukprot:SAG22_NODE_47_length_24699_cov_13.602317_12_plen_213_part_00
MADINYFLEISPECVKFILNQLGVEEVGRAACVCREFYKALSPRAKTIVCAIQWVERIDRRALTKLTDLRLRLRCYNQIIGITPLSALTSLTTLELWSATRFRSSAWEVNPGGESDETLCLLKSRGCAVLSTAPKLWLCYFSSNDSTSRCADESGSRAAITTPSSRWTSSVRGCSPNHSAYAPSTSAGGAGSSVATRPSASHAFTKPRQTIT